jgi:hypothetical protein
MAKWSEQELLVAAKRYCELPFGKIHSTNPTINAYASKECLLIGDDAGQATLTQAPNSLRSLRWITSRSTERTVNSLVVT